MAVFFSKVTKLGRDRWVEFKAKYYDASLVPPEWHAWLHRMTDKPGTEVRNTLLSVNKHHSHLDLSQRLPNLPILVRGKNIDPT